MLNLVVPMAGKGQRFVDEGYTIPKAFFNVKGKPMIELVVENLALPKANIIFIAQEAHLNKYGHILEKYGKIVPTKKITEGPASSCLLAEKYLDNSLPLLYANCDQYLEWKPQAFLDFVEDYDGGLLTHRDTRPYSSYALLDENGYVKKTAEKEVLGDVSSTGIYYWSKGSDFIRNTKSMIKKNRRASNGEFYAINIYNEGIEEGKKYVVYFVKKFWRIGMPNELRDFLRYDN